MLLLLGATALYIASKSGYVQTRLAQWAAASLSKRLGAEVRIERLEIAFVSSLRIKGLLIHDQQGDTLAAIPELSVNIKRLNTRLNRFRFEEIVLRDADIRLLELDSLGTKMNIDFLLDYFDSGSPEADEEPEGPPLLIDIRHLKLHNIDFRYINPYAPMIEAGVDLERIAATGLQADLQDLLIHGDTITAYFSEFRFREKSGFELHNLKGQARLDHEGVRFDYLTLEAQRSAMYGRVALLHDAWADYRNFTGAVRWDADFDSTVVNLGDIGYFAPELWGLDFPVAIDGVITGTIRNLKGRKLELMAGQRTRLRGNFDMAGLPDIANTFLDFRVQQLSSDYEDISHMGRQLGAGAGFFNALPLELKRAGSLHFDGSFTGFSTDFVAFGNLNTEAGPLRVDLNLETDTLTKTLVYNGVVKAKGFDIGRVLDIADLGRVTADAQVVARSRGTFISAEIDGVLKGLDYKGYSYQNITLDGTVSSKTFRGKLFSSDPNLMLRFDGLVDFSAKVPQFDFKASIHNADFTALRLVDMPQTLSLSSTIEMRGQGSDFDNMSGTLSALQSHLCYGDSALFIPSLRLTALNVDDLRKISLASDIADISITGRFIPSELYMGLYSQLAEVVPSLAKPRPDQTFTPQQYDFSVVYKAPNLISGLLRPGLSIAPETTVYGSLNSASRSLSAMVRTQELSLDQYTALNLTVEAGQMAGVVNGSATASKLAIGTYEMENLYVNAQAFDDLIQLGLGWLNEDGDSSGDLNLRMSFEDDDVAVLAIDRAVVAARSLSWQLDSPALVWVDKDRVQIDTLAFTNDMRYIALAGSIGTDPSERLHVSVSNFDLADIDSLGFDLGSKLKGLVNLDAWVTEVYNTPRLTANGTITDLWIDAYQLGDVDASSTYRTDEKDLLLRGSLTRNGYRILNFDGKYILESEEPLDGNIYFDQFNLEVINVLGLEEITDITGRANGKVQVKGPVSRPELSGHIDFKDARFRIDYLNTYFKFSDRLRIEDGWFGIDYKPIFDQEGNKGFVVLSVVHFDFENWSYDISAEVENFFVLNTTRAMNDIFYGTARTTGSFQIGVFGDLLEINIDARTGRGTSIKLPLDEPGDVTLENFVHFVNRSDESSKTQRTASLENIQMRVNLDITTDAEVQLVFNEQTGDIMRGKGEGLLTLEIAPSGEFKMFGRYDIVDGNYLFTLRDLLNKQFQVRPGGSIGWYGDPYDADIDITAVYALRTPLYPIMVENRDRYRAREDVNVVLNLTEKLMNPNIGFEIELPQSTENERSQLTSIVSTSQQLNQQVFALLILNRFLPAGQNQEQEAGGGMSGLGAATTSDFVSTQISNWLSQISRDFDIGINYRPGDQISNQEVAVALSTQLFNERLSVRGNFGVTSATQTQYARGQSGILGDFLLEYSLTENGAIRLKVFNETNPYEVFSTAGSMYTQGVGLVYQEDFNNIDEFLAKVGSLFKNGKEKGK